MDEIHIDFDKESPQDKNTDIIISAEKNVQENLLYKFLIGFNGTWKMVSDFSQESKVSWSPQEDGNYVIMVQAKKAGSKKALDYISRSEYVIGKINQKIIKRIYVEKSELNVGDKLLLNVQSDSAALLYRYWIKENGNWQLIKDYSPEDMLSLRVIDPGIHEILVECKKIDSKNNFDDFEKNKFIVKALKKVEIKNLKLLSRDIIADSELVFEVDTESDNNRTILYRFVKINSNGETECIQDYSTKKMISFAEKNSGSYKLLCMTKDMYSPNEYDDRAVINYNVKKYNPVKIESFTTDVSSPQINGTDVSIKAVAEGGKTLLYRFVIEGICSEDSGYIKDNFYMWNTKKEGKYKLSLFVKDESFEGKFEDSSSMDFTVDEINREPVKIQEVCIDKNKDEIVKNTPVHVKVCASGGLNLRYSFMLRKEDSIIEKINYGACSWVYFTPDEKGKYEIEVMVKDKYSKKEYDAHSLMYIDVCDYIPAKIDYVLIPPRNYYIIDDKITLNVITGNTSDVLLNYVFVIGGRTIRKTGYIKDKVYAFTPKFPGNYTVLIYAKNKESIEKYDSKKEMNFVIHDTYPITNTKLKCDKTKIICGTSAAFSASCEGGKDVLYEFYLMENGDWNLAQKFGKKNNYCFMAFEKGNYKMLVLSRSEKKKCFYEDYDLLEFSVE